ncbi:MAG: regulatory protein TetR [Gemmatimonadetes bacterium]|nr:regulatory protein TetR [Gemmatimonadota bacterium]
MSSNLSRASTSLQTRDRIREVAFHQVDTGGLEALSVRGIAAEVGLSPMAIYRHFENRDAIIAALVADGVARLEERLRQAPDLAPYDRLRALLEAYASFGIEEPTSYYVIFFSRRPSDAPFIDENMSVTAASFEILRGAVADAISAGALARRNSVEVTLTVWAQAHGLVSLYVAGRFGGGEESFRRLFDNSIALLLGGLSS